MVVVYVVRAVEPTTVVTNTSNKTRADVQAQGQQDHRRPHDDQLRKITLHKTTTPLRFIQTLMKHVQFRSAKILFELSRGIYS